MASRGLRLRRLVVPANNNDGSPVTEHCVKGRRLFVKRDDLFRLEGSGLSGNKARKLFAVHNIPSQDFPKRMCSHGGAQSNAMLAIAKLAKSRGSEFFYFMKRLPDSLVSNPTGNFKAALELGMRFIPISPVLYKELFDRELLRKAGAIPETIADLGLLPDEERGGGGEVNPEAKDYPLPATLWLPQGGACSLAEEGRRI
eukprot:jgi/Bigna1/145573/aug1.100_g20281